MLKTKPKNSETSLAVVYHSASDLLPYKNNPRTHSSKQVQQLVRSIEQFGFTNPILVDAERNIIAGHGRLLAAKQLGMDQIPTIRLDHMTEAQKKAYIIADNKLAENAGWDQDLLALEIKYISELDISFDLTVLGFEMPELDIFLSDEAIDEEEEPVAAPSGPVISQLGDKWLLGRHVLICADATKAASFEQLLGDERPEIVFTDPPYNVKVNGHICGKGTQHEEFVMATGEMSETEFTKFLSDVLSQLVNFTSDGSLHYICMDWRHMRELLAAGGHYKELKNLCIWNKTNGGMGSFYRSKHELVFVFKNGTAPHTNNVSLGKYGRYRTNVWDYAGVNTFKNDREAELEMHPTVKPVKMIADAILDASQRNGLILDCFGGSGSTLIAAEQTQRIARLLELDPKYVDVTIRRFEKTTGQKARLEGTGQSFKEVESQRLAERKFVHVE